MAVNFALNPSFEIVSSGQAVGNGMSRNEGAT